MPFLVLDGKDIERLAPDELRSVLNATLEAEALSARVPSKQLDLSTRNNDPDAGLDARVEWPPGTASEILLGGENALQYKAGKLTPTVLKKEFGKPGVVDTLKRGGNYILCVGHDYNPTHAKNWRNELRKLAKSRKIDPDKCAILFASSIGRIANQYPSVIILPELRKDIPLFLTVARWSHQHSLKWTPDEPRLETIKRIGFFLQDEKSRGLLRIEGPAGVGKTRVVLQAIQEHGAQALTIYAPNSEDNHVQELLSFLVGSVKSRATIVADECSADRQATLRAYVEACGGRVKLICIGTPDLLSPRLSASANLIHLPPLPDSQIHAILNEIEQPVPIEIVNTAVRVAKGFVKLAVFVVQQLLQQRDLNLLELSKIGDVGDFLRRFLQREIRRVLEAFSLLARVGWGEELIVEAQCIAEFLGIPMTEMKSGVSSLRNQGVLMDQGRYCYVSPDLLAIFAAAELWGEQGPELMQVIEKLPTREPRVQLLRRLAAMGEHPDVRKAVEKMLQPEGAYKSLGDLDDEFRGEMLRILASALPEAASEVLRRIINQTDHDTLLGFRPGRRNAVWTLESLLRWPTTSLEAARTLRKLALAENESIGNNATAIFCQFFHVYLSGTPTSYEERLPLLDDLIRQNTPESLQLAVKAIESGLAHYESRVGGNVDDLSGRPYPEEWKPKKWDELWTARRELIARLNQLSPRTDEIGQQARAALTGSVFTLIRDGIWGDAITLLENLNPSTDSERRGILDAAKRIEREVGKQLSEEERGRISNIESACFGESFSSRLHRWVGKRIHADYDLEGKTGFEAADAEVTRLAEEAYNQGLSSADLKWLATPEADNSWQFGRRLGELDSNSQYLPQILNVSPKNINPLFLAGYLAGQELARGAPFRESFLEELSKSEPILAFALTWRGTPSQRGLVRILRLVDTGAIPPEMMGYLAYGGWTNSFSSDEVKQILDRLLRGPASKTLDPAMGIALNLLQRDPNAFEQVEPVLWRMVEIKPEHAWSWEWGLLAGRLAQKDPRRITSTVLSFFAADEHYLVYTHSEERKVLFQAAALSPKDSWDLVAGVLSKKDATTHRLLLALDESYGEAIPTNVLVDWARQHLPFGPAIVAQLVSIKSKNLPERARTLLREFPGDKHVQSVIAGQLSSGSWTGSFSGRVQYELEIAEGWAKDPEPAVREFAKLLVNNLKQRLKHQLIREEEGHYM